MQSTFIVIMAGGIGSRYWPISRVTKPKQFIDILGTGRTLIQMTYDRFRNHFSSERFLVVTNEIYQDLVLEQLPELTPDQVLCEPYGKNTAPCIAYAAFKIQSKYPDAKMIVVPSDHLILDNKAFMKTILAAWDFTCKNLSLVTIGIQPHRPDTGYGYIQFKDDPSHKSEIPVFKVKTFTEKPTQEIAISFIESGDFLWNAGIFIFTVKNIVQSFKLNLPELFMLFQNGKGVFWTSDEKEYITKLYSQSPNISIDYGIMEKDPNVYVVPGNFGWSDLGTWKSLYEVKEKNESGNAVTGKMIHIYDSTGNIIQAPEGILVVINGVHDKIIAVTDSIVYISDKEKEQETKQITTDLKLHYGEKFQ